MGLVADYADLPVVLLYSQLPAFDSGTNVGKRILVASISKIARWTGSAWTLSDVNSSVPSSSVAAVVAALTDGNMTGSADGAMTLVGSTSGGDVSGAIMSNFKECQTQINAIIAALKAAGLMSLT